MSIITEIKKNQAKAFRRIYMRRRSASDYEASWTEVPKKYIRNYGEVEYGIEGIRVNFFNFSGYNFTVDNVDGYFADVDDDRSFFYGYACVPRTMVKVEAGYLADDGTEYPTASTLFVGLIGGNLDYKDNNLVDFQCDHLSKVFEEFNAAAIPNMSGNYTASEIVTKIKNYQDSNTVYVFQKYLSSTAWSVTTTTTQYVMSTSTSLQNINCWELMSKLAEAENYITGIDRSGNFFFDTRSPALTSIVFHFSGLNDYDKSYGHNIMKGLSISKKFNKIYNRIRIKHDTEETTTSYYTKAETWAWGDSTSSYLYGVKTYSLENEFLNTASSIVISENIYNEYVDPKWEVKLNAKFVPHLDLNDPVTITYRTKILQTGDVWGGFLWGYGLFGARVGYNINLEDREFKIIRLSHSIEDFYTQVDLREL